MDYSSSGKDYDFNSGLYEDDEKVFAEFDKNENTEIKSYSSKPSNAQSSQNQQQQSLPQSQPANVHSNINMSQQQSSNANRSSFSSGNVVDPAMRKRDVLDGSKAQGKIFMGGLKPETTEDAAINYFSQFGKVKECVIMQDTQTGRSRGFGFLMFEDPSVVQNVLNAYHEIEGKKIDVKKATPRDNPNETEKIFVGGIPQSITEEDFRSFFSKYGNIVDANYLMDKVTNKPRGFGFITFDTSGAVQAVLEAQNRGEVLLHGKRVDVKAATAKNRIMHQQAKMMQGGMGGPMAAMGMPGMGMMGMMPYGMMGMTGAAGMMGMGGFDASSAGAGGPMRRGNNRQGSANRGQGQQQQGFAATGATSAAAGYTDPYAAMAAQYAGYYGYDPSAYMSMYGMYGAAAGATGAQGATGADGSSGDASGGYQNSSRGGRGGSKRGGTYHPYSRS